MVEKRGVACECFQSDSLWHAENVTVVGVLKNWRSSQEKCLSVQQNSKRRLSVMVHCIFVNTDIN